MPITVLLQDENGGHICEAVTDHGNCIAMCLPPVTDASYACVRFIDAYGDTVLNHLQAAAMIGEWDRLEPCFTERDSATIWNDIRGLIVRCSQEPHTYLKFVGD